VIRKSFSIHSDYYDELLRLDDSSCGKLLKRLIIWACDEQNQPLDPEYAILYRLIISQIERISAINSAKGNLGGAPKGNQNALKSTKTSQNKPNKPNKPSVAETASNSNTKANAYTTKEWCASTQNFSPPTIEEVTKYCVERGNSIDPEAFHDFYTSNGWKVGKSDMKDWRASVRVWERNDYGHSRAPPQIQAGDKFGIATQDEIIQLEKIRDKVKGG